MSEFQLGKETAKQITEIQKDFNKVNDLLIRIATIQFLIEWNDDCIKCKCEWFEFGEYLVEEFKHLSFQVMNK